MSHSIPANALHVNTLHKTAMDLLARGYNVVAVAADKRPLAKWEQLMAPNPPREVVNRHLQALASGDAQALGIVNGVNNIVCIDIDAFGDEPVDETFADDILVRLGLNRGFAIDDPWTWRSLSGKGIHIWATVPDLPQDARRMVIKVPSTTLQYGFVDRAGVRQIEVRAHGCSTVIPPTVTIPDGAPPPVNWETLLWAVSATEKPGGGGSAVARNDDPRQDDQNERFRRGENKIDPNAMRVLATWLSRVHDATEGTRNDTLFRAACIAGRLASAGIVDRYAVEDALMDNTSLSLQEAARTIRSGIERGLSIPWEPANRRRIEARAS